MNKKKIILAIIVALQRLSITFSQPATPEDIKQILQIPVLTGETTASTIPPNAGRLCFDKQLVLHSVAPDGAKLETDLYINSRLGYFDYYQFTGLSDGRSLMPDRDGFRFTLKTLAGNTYVYVTSMSGGRIKKMVITTTRIFITPEMQGLVHLAP